jgi:ribosomal protein S27E
MRALLAAEFAIDRRYAFQRRFTMTERSEPVEVVCPACQRTQIVYIPKEEIPKCPECQRQMVLRELLREGKSY